MGLCLSNPDKSDASILAKHVSSTAAKNKNFVISPLSLHLVLSLIVAGSSGATQKQVLLSFFKSFKSSNDLNKHFSELVSFIFVDDNVALGGPKLRFANGIWVDQTLPLKPTFVKVVNDAFKAVSKQVDFIKNASEAESEVNSWVEEHTNGLIRDLLPFGSITSTTRLVFANGIYFKGAWDPEYKFDPSSTVEDDFHLTNGNTVRVPFMTTTYGNNKRFMIGQFSGFNVLRLPYKKQEEDLRQFSMYVFLPNNNKDGSIPSMMAKVGSMSDFLDKHLPFENIYVADFMLPRFKISFGFEASSLLKGLGIKYPFNEGGLAEMVNTNEARNLCVSNIFRKSFIEVNEEGTEAAAASGLRVTFLCAVHPASKFVADHPFVFAIREDKTGVVLFIGYVMNPLES